MTATWHEARIWQDEAGLVVGRDPQMTQMDADLVDDLAGRLNHICAHLRHPRIIPSPA